MSKYGGREADVPDFGAETRGILWEVAAQFFRTWRDGRVVEGARLESVFRGNSNVGSNPTLSAII